MPAYRDKRDGKWRWRKVVRLPDGTKKRMRGTPAINTKEAALEDERDAIKREVARIRDPEATRKEDIPTFGDWFNGRFWTEWVVSKENKPSEVEAKRSVFRHHLEPAFGRMRLDEIDTAAIARFRATLLQRKPKAGRHAETKKPRQLSRKRINNILAVLSKALRYAEDARVIRAAPRVGLLKWERPEIEAWDFEQYVRILRAALNEDPVWYAAVCLAGEAGLRVGEIKALRWREGVDLVAGTVTISQQTRKGVTGTPKGGKRRTVFMTSTLLQALKRLEHVRTGFVVRNLDGTQKTDGQCWKAVKRICRRAGLPERGWHALRHTFGTHAALLGVNPWRLQAWMGHKRIDETMLYVHVAGNHLRPLPPELHAAAGRELDPDRRIIRMLGARSSVQVEPASAQEVTA